MAQTNYNPFDLIEKRLDFIQGLLTDIKLAPTNQIIEEPDQYIDQKKVSELLGVSSVTIWDWEKKGILKSYRIGTLKRFKLSEIMEAPRPIKRTQAVLQS